MGTFKEVDGDLIKLALAGEFDVICHGVNCQCIMGSGLAPQMAKAFGADRFSKENDNYRGEMNKLGTIDYAYTYLKGEKSVVDYKTPYVYTVPKVNHVLEDDGWHRLVVVNCYSQFDITGRRSGNIDLDYNALALCFKKMNHIFAGKHIGLPLIGGGLAGGDANIIKELMRASFNKCDVTLVNYQK